MDTKRTLLAVVVSFVILFGWNYFAQHMGWIAPPAEPAPQTASQVDLPTPQVESHPLAPLPSFAPAPGREVTVETPRYKAVLYSGGGILRQFTLKDFRADNSPESARMEIISPAAAAKAPMGLLVNGTPSWSTGDWSFDGGDLLLAAGQKGTLRFTGEVAGIRIVREFEFDADFYAIRETTTAESATPQTVGLGYTLGTGRLDDGNSEYNHTRLAWDQGGSYTEESGEKDMIQGLKPSGNIYWAAVMSNYFTAAVSPNNPDVTVNAVLEDKVFRVAVKKDGLMLSPGQPMEFGGLYYMGPKDQDQLSQLPNNMSSLVHYGFFSIISRPLIAMLKFFYSYVGNWGLAIIVLTVLIKIVLWPLSHKSYKSMQQMKKLQPEMAKLKEKYKDDKETFNREMMRLYKLYKVNPMGGCLPIVLQIPIFFGLYQGLMNAIELRHATFISTLPFTDMAWLTDLSTKDPYYITPIIMGATMFLQQWLTPTTGDPTQKKIMMFMPLIFTVLFLNFPSGLVIYWLTNNVISIGQQWWQLRKA